MNISAVGKTSFNKLNKKILQGDRVKTSSSVDEDSDRSPLEEGEGEETMKAGG